MLQKRVNRYFAQGVPGAKATPDQSVYMPVNPIADEDVQAGSFVFPVLNGGELDFTKATAKYENQQQLRGAGFVERVINYVNFDVMDGGSLKIPAGQPLTVAMRGDYYAVFDTDAKPGDRVVYDPDTQKATLIAWNGSLDAKQDLGWVVKTAGAAGEPVIISNWNGPAPQA